LGLGNGKTLRGLDRAINRPFARQGKSVKGKKEVKERDEKHHVVEEIETRRTADFRKERGTGLFSKGKDRRAPEFKRKPHIAESGERDDWYVNRENRIEQHGVVQVYDPSEKGGYVTRSEM